MSEIERVTSSRFDAIRRVDEQGEHWDGRDLMPLLDYDRWENFAEVIERARVAISAAGGDPDADASRRHEASGRARRVNYRLSRYGAYITAMVGDVAELTAATERATMRLAAHIDDQPPQLDLPDGIWFGLVQPRHLHGDWDTHQAAQQRAREARAVERAAEVRRREDARLSREQAQARIRAVLPDHPIVTPIYGTGLPESPTLTWEQLADLLDAYADARPAAALNAGEGT